TDSRLLETARTKLVEAAIALKQTFAKKGEQLSRQAGRYAHARQFKRMRRKIKHQRTIVGRLVREIDHKASAMGRGVRAALGDVLLKAQRIVVQSTQRKALKGHPKLYAWHAPEVDCIRKGVLFLWRLFLRLEKWSHGAGCGWRWQHDGAQAAWITILVLRIRGS